MAKMDSLKSRLNREIREKGKLTYGEVVQIAVEEGYKVSTAERRLRPSESPNVEAIEKQSKKGTWYIAEYRYKAPPEEKKPEPVDNTQGLFQNYPKLNKAHAVWRL